MLDVVDFVEAELTRRFPEIVLGTVLSPFLRPDLLRHGHGIRALHQPRQRWTRLDIN